MMSLKKRFSLALATFLFSLVALPAVASADICSIINYTFDSDIEDQVRAYVGSNYIDSSDAACILSNIRFDSTKQKVGVFLASHLIDPENVNLLANEATFSDTKMAIIKASANARPPVPQYREEHRGGHHRPNHGGGHYRHEPRPNLHIVNNVHDKIDFTFTSRIMPQLKAYVSGDALVYASDAANILRSAKFASAQEEIGTYLATRLADPDNLYLLVEAVTFQSTKTAILNAAR